MMGADTVPTQDHTLHLQVLEAQDSAAAGAACYQCQCLMLIVTFHAHRLSREDCYSCHLPYEETGAQKLCKW